MSHPNFHIFLPSPPIPSNYRSPNIIISTLHCEPMKPICLVDLLPLTMRPLTSTFNLFLLPSTYFFYLQLISSTSTNLLYSSTDNFLFSKFKLMNFSRTLAFLTVTFPCFSSFTSLSLSSTLSSV